MRALLETALKHTNSSLRVFLPVFQFEGEPTADRIDNLQRSGVFTNFWIGRGVGLKYIRGRKNRKRNEKVAGKENWRPNELFELTISQFRFRPANKLYLYRWFSYSFTLGLQQRSTSLAVDIVSCELHRAMNIRGGKQTLKRIIRN